MKNTLVICFSTSSYDASIWTNKQHLMSRLSEKEGYKIIYVDQGMSNMYFKMALFGMDWKYFFFPLRKRSKNLWTLSPYFLPLLKGGVIKKISWTLLKKYISILSYLIKYDKIIYWVYQPQAWYLIRNLNKSDNVKILYDCVDEFSSQPFYKNSEKRISELLEIERKLTIKADFVTTTSLGLYEDKKFLNVRTNYIHNVGDFQHFRKPNKILEKKEFGFNDNRKVVLYAGVIDDYKTDIELISRISQKLEKNYIFVLVGPIRISSRLLSKINLRNNVILLGQKKYQEIPDYLHASDILWLPYQSSSHTNRVFPIKLFEYLSTGKPIISRTLESLKDYSQYLYCYDDDIGLIQSFEKIESQESLKNVEARIKIAKINTWESRLDKILNFIDEN